MLCQSDIIWGSLTVRSLEAAVEIVKKVLTAFWVQIEEVYLRLVTAVTVKSSAPAEQPPCTTLI